MSTGAASRSQKALELSGAGSMVRDTSRRDSNSSRGSGKFSRAPLPKKRIDLLVSEPSFEAYQPEPEPEAKGEPPARVWQLESFSPEQIRNPLSHPSPQPVLRGPRRQTACDHRRARPGSQEPGSAEARARRLLVL